MRSPCRTHRPCPGFGCPLLSLLLTMLLFVQIGCGGGGDGGTEPPPPVTDPPTIPAWTWMNPDPVGFSINAVTGSAGDDLYAAGDQGTILHYDGLSWQQLDAPAMGALDGMLADATGSLVVIGRGGDLATYDGNAWSEPSLSSLPALNAIWGVDAENCAVAGNGGTVVLCEEGVWSVSEINTTSALTGVWGTSTTDLYAIAQTRQVFHYDGVSWTSSNLGSNNLQLSDVWGASSSDVYVSANQGTTAMLFHFDGVSWEQVTGLPDLSFEGSFVALDGVSSDGVAALLSSGSVLLKDAGGWTLEAIDDQLPANVFTDVKMLGSGEVLVSGQSGTIASLSGGVWQALTTNVAPAAELEGVSGGGASDVHVVGSTGAWHYDGIEWSASEGAGNQLQDLNAVWAYDASLAIAAGRTGRILRWDGASWSVESTGGLTSGSDVLRAVWGTGPSDIHVAGDYGRLLHYDGAAWEDLGIPTFQRRLRAIWGSGPNDVWACGDAGSLLHYDGSSWTERAPLGTATLTAIWGSSATDVRAASLSVVYHNEGGSWHMEALPTAAEIAALAGAAADDIHALTVDGRILHYNGRQWAITDIQTYPSLSALWAAPTGEFFAAGTQGTLLHRGPAIR